jgi:hypothetical protein
MRNSPALSLEQDAVISECGKYRYLLTRRVGLGDRTATFIMLNPSTADALNDDPTIRRCIGFAHRWGCGRLVVTNLFAVRATDPADMRTASDPVGPENLDWVTRAVEMAVAPCGPADRGPVVCAWGTHGSYMDQDRTVLGEIERVCTPMALGITRDGHPKHPLYVPYYAERVPLSRTRAEILSPSFDFLDCSSSLGEISDSLFDDYGGQLRCRNMRGTRASRRVGEVVEFLPSLSPQFDGAAHAGLIGRSARLRDMARHGCGQLLQAQRPVMTGHAERNDSAGVQGLLDLFFRQHRYSSANCVIP